jgi:CHAT domain-containing protein/tetratricopeptide (TPR) repeat protein
MVGSSAFLRGQMQVAGAAVSSRTNADSPPPSLTAAPPNGVVEEDLTALRKLANEYYAAYAGKDIETLTSFWSSTAPDSDNGLQATKQFFAEHGLIVVTDIAVQSATIDGQKAHLQVTFDLSTGGAKAGEPLFDLGKNSHLLECVKENGAWKIRHDTDAAIDLAASLAAASAEQAKDALLTQDKALVNPTLVMALVARAKVFIMRGEFDQALRVLTIAKDVAVSIADRRGAAYAQMGIGEVLIRTGKYAQAQDIYRSGVATGEELRDKAISGAALTMIGYMQWLTSNWNEALETLRRSLALAEDAGNKILAAKIMRYLAGIYSDQGNYSLALEYLENGLRVYDSTGDRGFIAITLFAIGRTYDAEHKDEQALEYLSRSLALAQELGDQDTINRLLECMGALYQRRGDWTRALEYYQRSLALCRTLQDRHSESIVLNNIGELYFEQNDLPQALSYYQRSLELARQVGNEWLAFNTTMGTIYQLQGNYDKALQHLQKGLAGYERMGKKAGAVQALNGIGSLYYDRKDYEQAFGYFSRSLELARELGDQYRIAAALTGMAKVRHMQKNFAKALELAEQASAITRNSNDRGTFWQSRWVAGLAYMALHETDAARVALDEAIEAVESLRQDVAGGSEEQLRFFANRLGPYHDMVALQVQQSQLSQALSYTERAKGRALLDVLGSGGAKITKAMTPAEREREEDLEAQIVSLNRQLAVQTAAPKPNQEHVAELKSGLEKTRLQYSDFQTLLYNAHPELQTQRGQIQPLSAGDTLSLLPDKRSAVLEFLVTEEKTYLFVLTRSNAPGKASGPELHVYTIAIKAADLDQRTEQFRRQLSMRDLQIGGSAAKLFELLVRPAQAQLAGVSVLLVVPDGPLWNLPFQALRHGNHYLAEEYAIAYAPSLTVLREMIHLHQQKKQTGPASRSARLLVMADPVLGKDSLDHAAMAYRGETLGPLPAARQEALSLKQLYQGQDSETYIGAEAREDRFKAEAGRFGILHLATHGILDNANPMYSNVLLSPGDTGKEDGLLEAREIMQLDLNASLAVLSACETGRGRVSAGEGVIGLSWAFFVAGTSSTLVSQWKVESASTARLMVGFYRALRAERDVTGSTFSTARALQHAEVLLLRSQPYAHPFYWAGFIVVGDPN